MKESKVEVHWSAFKGLVYQFQMIWVRGIQIIEWKTENLVVFGMSRGILTKLKKG